MQESSQQLEQRQLLAQLWFSFSLALVLCILNWFESHTFIHIVISREKKNKGLFGTSACVFVIHWQIIGCFRHCLHGVLQVLKRLLQQDLAFAFSSSMWVSEFIFYHLLLVRGDDIWNDTLKSWVCLEELTHAYTSKGALIWLEIRLRVTIVKLPTCPSKEFANDFIYQKRVWPSLQYYQAPHYLSSNTTKFVYIYPYISLIV